jgi:hypothetical protein
MVVMMAEWGETGETRAPVPWWSELSLPAGFVVLTVALAGGALLDLDVAVRDWCDAHQPHAAHWVARWYRSARRTS